MSDVGVILENFLCVRRKGKWKRRWCVIEKHATFTNSLRLFIWNTDKSVCYTQDAVNAYLWFLDPNHQGTLMLVCDYKVRCISFDNFEELNRWVERLKTFLTCNYFHADLVLASKESKLHSHARRRRRQLHSIASQKRTHSLAGNTNATGIFRTSAVTASGDGYLHVTRDRICFTTGPGCARPRLLATWSFDNDDLVQCGTARGKHVDDLDDSDDTNRASLFFLTASPNHTEAPGSHLFISGRAAELCEWIEANNKGAVYQAEWRQFTSLAAVKDQPFSSPLPNQSFLVDPLGMSGVSNPDSYSTLLCSTALSGHPFQTCCQCGLPSELGIENERNERNSELDAPYRLCHRTQDNRDFHQQFSTESAMHRTDESGGSSCERSSIHDLEQIISSVVGCIPPPRSSDNRVENMPPSPRPDSKPEVVAENVASLTAAVATDTGTTTNSPLIKAPCQNCLAQAEFLTRKQRAMRSRRRFSSHPVDAQGSVHISFSPFSSASSAVHSEGLDVIPHSAPDRSSFRQSICNPSQDVPISDPWMHTCPRCPLGCQRRQSDSQLVTLPPIPLSLHELCEFLRRPKYEVTAQAVCSEKQPTKEVLKSAMACAQQTSSQSPQSGPVAQMDETADIDFQRSRYSRCSTTSASDSASSDQRCLDCSCSHCAVALGAGEAWALSGVGPLASAGNSEHMKGNLDTTSHPVLNCPATRRRRLPSSWSTATGVCPHGIDNSNLPSAGLWTSSGVMPGSGKPPPLSRSLSSGNSPPCAFTPLLPTSSVIPGSQLFFHRRQHTVSASEVIPPTVTDCVTSERCDSAAASVSVATVNDWSAKASLVSLSPGSIPLWADAPNYAKPRTGFNYVSRESLLTLHALRKQRQQAICHTPHHYHHHKDGNGSVSTSAPVSSSAVHQTYACTPLPKLLEMDNARAEQLSGRDHSQSSQCDCCNLGNPTQAQQYTTEPVNVPCRDSPASRLGRSYVNMAPPPRRVGLRPIEEHQSTRSAHTQPVGRRFRSDTTAPLIESIDTGSCSVTTLSSYINISDLSKTSLSANAAVSSAMTGSPISASNTSIALTVQQPYINLVPSINSNGTTADRGPRPVPTCVHSQRPSCTGALVVSGYDVPITSSLSHQTTVVSSTATVNETHLEVPRLHYAHLTLSTNPDWRRGSSAGQSSSALTRLGSPTVESTSHLHGVHSVPATIFSDPSGALCPTSRPTEEESSTSGLNYVTIDLVQTKALSELERELRFNSAATNLLPLQRQTNTSRGLLRSHRKRGQPNSSDTHTSTVTNEPQTGIQHTDRGASHSGMRTGRDSLSSLSRIRSYLTHHLHSSSAFRSFARPPPAPSQNTTNTTP